MLLILIVEIIFQIFDYFLNIYSHNTPIAARLIAQKYEILFKFTLSF